MEGKKIGFVCNGIIDNYDKHALLAASEWLLQGGGGVIGAWVYIIFKENQKASREWVPNWYRGDD